MSRYNTNFTQGMSGNILVQGKDLTITITGEPTPLYVIGQLFRRRWYGKQLIQIEQSGSRQNPQKDSITFEMKERKDGQIVRMPDGAYRIVTYAYIPSVGGKRWGDNFIIV